MIDIDDFFCGASCEVKTLTNQLLLIGTVQKIERNDQVVIDIVSKNGEPLQYIEYGLHVKLILRKKDKFLVLGGEMYASTKTFWRIVNIEIFQNSERRKFFRVSSSAYARAADASDETLKNTHDIKLIDISLSGMKFFCEHDFKPDEIVNIFNLYLTPDLPTFEFCCHLVACVPVDGGFECRGNFIELSDFVIDMLCKAIFKIERENTKNRNKKIII